jgi:hypothetical protein
MSSGIDRQSDTVSDARTSVWCALCSSDGDGVVETSEMTPDVEGGPVLAVYLLVLPDPLPIADGNTWVRGTDEPEPLLDGVEFSAREHLPPIPQAEDGKGHNFVSFRFWQVPDDRSTCRSSPTALVSLPGWLKS